MKLSKFNVFMPYQNAMLGYNTFSNQFMFLNPLLHQLLEAAESHNNIKELGELHKGLYDELVKNGFVVPSDRNEINELKKISKAIDLSKDSFNLTINPTMNCNFKCWYCYETHIKDSKMSSDIVKRTNKFMKNIISGNDQLRFFNLSFFGGEPLLNYYNVVEPILEAAIEYTQDKGVNFFTGFTTNGFLINNKMLKRFKHYGVHHFQITLDGNRETHDTIRFVSKKRGSYDKIIRSIKMLCEAEIQVRIRINYTSKTLEGIADIIPDLQTIDEAYRKYFTIDFHQVWQNKEELTKDSMDMIQRFIDQGLPTTSANKFPDNVINSCYADKKNSATINYNGEVFKCTARDFTTANREGILTEDGIIEWDPAKLEKRLNAKFKNKPCLECFFMPLCNGGCSQHAIENEGTDYCVYGFDEQKKKDMVMNKFLLNYA